MACAKEYGEGPNADATSVKTVLNFSMRLGEDTVRESRYV